MHDRSDPRRVNGFHQTNNLAGRHPLVHLIVGTPGHEPNFATCDSASASEQTFSATALNVGLDDAESTIKSGSSDFSALCWEILLWRDQPARVEPTDGS